MKKFFGNIAINFMPQGNNPFVQVGIAKWYIGQCESQEDIIFG
jgi:hypothetical protein